MNFPATHPSHHLPLNLSKLTLHPDRPSSDQLQPDGSCYPTLDPYGSFFRDLLFTFSVTALLLGKCESL